jgi:hypothetical protein
MFPELNLRSNVKLLEGSRRDLAIPESRQFSVRREGINKIISEREVIFYEINFLKQWPLGYIRISVHDTGVNFACKRRTSWLA